MKERERETERDYFFVFVWLILGKVTTLDIGNNSIGPKGALHVANFIKKTKSLQWLNLYMNDIGDEVQWLIPSLKSSCKRVMKHCFVFYYSVWQTLTVVSICMQGAQRIAEALKRNNTLTTLDLVCDSMHLFLFS